MEGRRKRWNVVYICIESCWRRWYIHVILCRHSWIFSVSLGCKSACEIFMLIPFVCKCRITHTRFHTFVLSSSMYFMLWRKTVELKFFIIPVVRWYGIRIDACWRWTVSGVLSAVMFFIDALEAVVYPIIWTSVRDSNLISNQSHTRQTTAHTHILSRSSCQDFLKSLLSRCGSVSSKTRGCCLAAS